MGETATAAEPRFTGFIDDFVSGRLYGWAVDRLRPDFDACLVVFAGDLIVGACRADILRPDLVPLMPGEGRHGFDCSLSEETFDADRIEVYAVTREVFDAITRADATEDDSPALRSRRDFAQAFEGLCGKIEGANEASLTLRDVWVGLDGGMPWSDADSPGLILVDVRDLLAFHRVHVRVSGIQRVLCGLISTLSTMQEAAHLEFCILSERPGFVHIVDKGLLRRFVSTLIGDDAVRQDLDTQIQALEGSVRLLRTRAVDTFFIAGAFWVYDHLDRHLARLREQGTRVGLCIHDLIPLTYPHLVSGSTRRAFVEHAVQAFPQFDFLFTTSRFVAEQARSILSIEVGWVPSIRSIPLPHRSMIEARPDDTVAKAVRPRSSPSIVDEPFALCVCTIEVRKNHILLYRVWAALLRKHGSAAVPRLVLVGRWGWNVEEFRQALDASDNLDGMVVVLSDVSDGALADLYRRSLFTVFPSFAEGWGLPVGESLAAGKVCIASHATAIPEVGGEFCAYFDPHDYLDAFAAIERPIVDREWLSARERQIVADFRSRSWADTSADLLCSLQAAHAESRPEQGQGCGPIFGATDVLDFTDLPRDDDRAPWRFRMAGTVLAAGWHPPDVNGAWASARKSVIALRTEIEPGTHATVLLRIAGTGQERPCRLLITGGGEVASVTVAGRRPRWHEVEVAVEPGGMVRLTISGPAGGLLAVHGQRSGFALLGLAICGDDVDGRMATYRKLLDAPMFVRASGEGHDPVS